jgi:hypothetical protein
VTEWRDPKPTPKERLAEIVKELFPNSIVPDVIESFIENGSRALHECAYYNRDQIDRMELYREASILVGKINDPQFGDEKFRDPTARCKSFTYGKASGRCKTDGHYLCDECKARDPKLRMDPDSKYYVPPMQRRKYKGEW